MKKYFAPYISVEAFAEGDVLANSYVDNSEKLSKWDEGFDPTNF